MEHHLFLFACGCQLALCLFEQNGWPGRGQTCGALFIA
jgi:hypothetical protein